MEDNTRIPLPKSKWQEQFEFEKAQLEKYGHASSLTYEEWLKIKGYSFANDKLQYIIETESEFLKKINDLTEGIAVYFNKDESLTVNTCCCEVIFKFK